VYNVWADSVYVTLKRTVRVSYGFTCRLLIRESVGIKIEYERGMVPQFLLIHVCSSGRFIKPRLRYSLSIVWYIGL
jgi:hypothetical protein